jgi:8-oxo-dGTP pyrophosphatase MutT (NUDIX family)
VPAIERQQARPVTAAGAQGDLVLVEREVALARSAHRAEPGVGDVLERGPDGDAAVGVAFLGVIDVAAGLADPALEGLGVHGGEVYRPASVVGVVSTEQTRSSGRARLAGRLWDGYGQRMSSPNAEARPGRGEEFNPGPATAPRQAATVIVLRGGDRNLEVLLVKRTPRASFMGGVWVFPGGAVESHEGEDDQAHRRAAVRELQEEAGIVLASPAELVKFSRWITPAEVVVRFDTHFFLAALPPGQEPKVDGEECVDLGWFTPAGALEAHARQEIALVFPTIKHLEQLGEFNSAAELLRHAEGREVVAVQPRVVLEGEVGRVVLPGEPGYE